MTPEEIKLMMRNFEATIPFRSIYKHPIDNTGALIDLIKSEIISGNNTTYGMLKAVNSKVKVQWPEFSNILKKNDGILWYLIKGKRTTKCYHLIDIEDLEF